MEQEPQESLGTEALRRTSGRARRRALDSVYVQGEMISDGDEDNQDVEQEEEEIEVGAAAAGSRSGRRRGARSGRKTSGRRDDGESNGVQHDHGEEYGDDDDDEEDEGGEYGGQDSEGGESGVEASDQQGQEALDEDEEEEDADEPHRTRGRSYRRRPAVAGNEAAAGNSHCPARAEGGGGDEHEPLYVNAKQYHRILKRRQARARLEEMGRLSRQRKVSAAAEHAKGERSWVDVKQLISSISLFLACARDLIALSA